ncbi:MAG: dioxygenase [Candidatus Binataceae bacterium]|jgi:catechol 1,2-dioxygenase
MKSAPQTKPANPRLNEVCDDLVATLKAFVRKHRIRYDEYHRALRFLSEAGDKQEIPLLMDVFFEMTVNDVTYADQPGTETTVEGPYYVPEPPLLKPPFVLPHRPNEPGDVLFFSGTVRSTDGAALGGAVVDIWQADAQAKYSHFNIPEAEAPFNLRGKLATDHNGRFEVQTWVPSAYEIPKAGPTGALLAALGLHAWRPAHLHASVSHEGHAVVTTQVFLKDDPWIHSDVVGAVKDSLIVALTKHDDPSELRNKGLKRPYYTASFDFVLPRVVAKAA